MRRLSKKEQEVVLATARLQTLWLNPYMASSSCSQLGSVVWICELDADEAGSLGLVDKRCFVLATQLENQELALSLQFVGMGWLDGFFTRSKTLKEPTNSNLGHFQHQFKLMGLNPDAVRDMMFKAEAHSSLVY